MTENKRKSIIILADTIQGEINRMCVTKELTELDCMYMHARNNLDKLLSMIYDDKFNNMKKNEDEYKKGYSDDFRECFEKNEFCTVIKKLNKKYYVEDSYGYTDEEIVKKVNEIIDVVTARIAVQE